jgi:hypothetical protein
MHMHTAQAPAIQFVWCWLCTADHRPLTQPFMQQLLNLRLLIRRCVAQAKPLSPAKRPQQLLLYRAALSMLCVAPASSSAVLLVARRTVCYLVSWLGIWTAELLWISMWLFLGSLCIVAVFSITVVRPVCQPCPHSCCAIHICFYQSNVR